MKVTKIFLVSLCLVFACHYVGFPQKGDSLAAHIEAYISPYVNTKNFSGTVLVAQNGKILYNKAFGMADEGLNVSNKTNTKYHIASVSKNFTAAAILLLEEKNLLNVTDTISKFIPGFPNGEKITIHQLLTHTSGIPNVNDMPEYVKIAPFPQTPATLIEIFRNKPLNFNPGSKYAYSNSNYNVLAYIIEKVSGKNYGDFLQENIFTPLGMTNTAHHASAGAIIENMASGYQAGNSLGLEKSDYLDWTTKTGNGSLYSTTEDLFKWDRALYTEKILSKKSLEKMFTIQAERTGYGWFIGQHLNRKRIYFNGRSPGFTSYFGRYPDEQLCIIVLANNYIPLATQIGSDIAAIYFHEKYEQPKINIDKLSPDAIKEVVGQYQFDENFYRPKMLMTIKEKDGHLFLDWGELIPNGPMKYIDRVYWVDVEFVKDSSGKISVLNYGNFKGIRKN
jgi:CubicO group peptidase (beta-lactamase class C family)